MSGWLDPDGIFHPCGFGDHVKYALELLNREEAQKGWTSASTDEMEELMMNQHISMSNGEQSTGGFISILGNITSQQVDWFNRFFYKLSGSQKATLTRIAQEQGIKLKYDW